MPTLFAKCQGIYAKDKIVDKLIIKKIDKFFLPPVKSIEECIAKLFIFERINGFFLDLTKFLIIVKMIKKERLSPHTWMYINLI